MKIMKLFNDKVIAGIMLIGVALLIIIVLAVYICIVYNSISIILLALVLLIAIGLEKIYNGYMNDCITKAISLTSKKK